MKKLKNLAFEYAKTAFKALLETFTDDGPG
jgi:hypothetical protein